MQTYTLNTYFIELV